MRIANQHIVDNVAARRLRYVINVNDVLGGVAVVVYLVFYISVGVEYLIPIDRIGGNVYHINYRINVAGLLSVGVNGICRVDRARGIVFGRGESVQRHGIANDVTVVRINKNLLSRAEVRRARESHRSAVGREAEYAIGHMSFIIYRGSTVAIVHDVVKSGGIGMLIGTVINHAFNNAGDEIRALGGL